MMEEEERKEDDLLCATGSCTTQRAPPNCRHCGKRSFTVVVEWCQTDIERESGQEWPSTSLPNLLLRSHHWAQCRTPMGARLDGGGCRRLGRRHCPRAGVAVAAAAARGAAGVEAGKGAARRGGGLARGQWGHSREAAAASGPLGPSAAAAQQVGGGARGLTGRGEASPGWAPHTPPFPSRLPPPPSA